MNMAVFFQKHSGKMARLFKKFYTKLFLNTNKKRIQYLRNAGAKIGENVTIGDLGILGSEPYLVEIGNNVYFSGTTTKLFTHEGCIMQLKHMGITNKAYDVFGKIKIGNNCFIGNGCVILKNATIGDNVIIGAGAVVSKSLPSNCVAAGVPARVVCTIEEFYLRNKDYLEDTISFNSYEKRQYVEKNMDKYDKKRKEHEVL